MSKAQTKSTPNNRAINQIWIGLAVLGLIFITTLSYMYSSFVTFRNTQLIDNRFRAYNHEKLVFCYDRGIKSCDDTSILTWNTDHPSDVFEYKSVQQLADQVQLSNF